jgi:hypothetical protein
MIDTSAASCPNVLTVLTALVREREVLTQWKELGVNLSFRSVLIDLDREFGLGAGPAPARAAEGLLTAAGRSPQGAQ